MICKYIYMHILTSSRFELFAGYPRLAIYLLFKGRNLASNLWTLALHGCAQGLRDARIVLKFIAALVNDDLKLM